MKYVSKFFYIYTIEYRYKIIIWIYIYLLVVSKISLKPIFSLKHVNVYVLLLSEKQGSDIEGV